MDNWDVEEEHYGEHRWECCHRCGVGDHVKTLLADSEKDHDESFAEDDEGKRVESLEVDDGVGHGHWGSRRSWGYWRWYEKYHDRCHC